MATKDVLTLEINGETFVAYHSIKDKCAVLQKAPIDPKDVEIVCYVSRGWIFNKMLDLQNKIEQETGVFPCDTVWVSGVRNIKKLGAI